MRRGEPDTLRGGDLPLDEGLRTQDAAGVVQHRMIEHEGGKIGERASDIARNDAEELSYGRREETQRRTELQAHAALGEGHEVTASDGRHGVPLASASKLDSWR